MMMTKMKTASKKMNWCLCLLTLSISMILIVEADHDYIRATCTITSLNEINKTVSGTIKLWQPTEGGNTTISGNLTGFTWSGKHGFHVHKTGNLSLSCNAADAHYNPFNKTHGGPNDAVRHVGDLGNIDVDNNYNSSFTIVDSMIQLQGNYSVVNRSLVVHAGEDDLGKGNQTESLITGNSGYRIGCCIITLDYMTTTPPTSTTLKPAGAAVSIQPLVTVLAFSLAAVQLAKNLMYGRLEG